MCDCRHGAQGLLDGASKGTLESEFGTHNEDDVMVKILERGEYQTSAVCLLSPPPPGSCQLWSGHILMFLPRYRLQSTTVTGTSVRVLLRSRGKRTVYSSNIRRTYGILSMFAFSGRGEAILLGL